MFTRLFALIVLLMAGLLSAQDSLNIRQVALHDSLVAFEIRVHNGILFTISADTLVMHRIHTGNELTRYGEIQVNSSGTNPTNFYSYQFTETSCVICIVRSGFDDATITEFDVTDSTSFDRLYSRYIYPDDARSFRLLQNRHIIFYGIGHHGGGEWGTIANGRLNEDGQLVYQDDLTTPVFYGSATSNQKLCLFRDSNSGIVNIYSTRENEAVWFVSSFVLDSGLPTTATFSNDFLVVGSRDHFTVYNIQQPGNIQACSTVPIPNLQKVQAWQDKLCVRTSTQLHVFRVLPDGTLVQLGWYPNTYNTQQISFHDNLILLNAGSHGVQVLEIDETAAVPEPAIQPERWSELRMVPNPFNQTVRLGVQLEQPAMAQLLVFDLLGRELRHQELGWLSAKVNWVGLDFPELASGIYVAQVVTPTEQFSRTFTLVK
jgi:hypothetical protein